MRSRSARLPSSPSDASPDPIPDVLYRSLAAALRDRCEQAYDARITVRRLRESSEHQTEVPLRVTSQGLPDLSARLVVTPLGDRTYAVRCSVEDGASRRFTFSRPTGAGARLSHAPELGRMLAEFLLDELKKQIGDRLLRLPSRSSPRLQRSRVQA